MAFPEKSLLLKQFHMPDDKLLFAKFIDQAYLCLKTGSDTFSIFTDPVRSYKMSLAFNKYLPNLYVSSFGGYDGAERLMMGFSEKKLIEHGRFPIEALKIFFEKKFKALEHKDILGAVLGLGVNRAKIGDVLIKDGYAVVLAQSEMANYINENLFRVGKVSVKVNYIIEKNEIFNIESMEERRISVASLRVDAIVAAAFKISRSESIELIGKEKVFINWSPVTSASKNVNEGDMLTARGKGRVKILGIEGTTKKERQVIKLLIY